MYTPFYKTWWFRVGLLIVVAWGVWFGYRIYDDWQFQAPARERYLEAVAFQKAYEAEQLALQARYALDFDGGKTPEETWEMFVEALERGDTEQAAKYFIIERQEEMSRQFSLGIDNGAVEAFLRDDITLIVGGDMYPDGERFEFYTGGIDGGPGFVYMLVKNPITGVWKIKEL